MDSSINIIKEKYLEDYPTPITSEGTEIILSQMRKNICKIYMNNGNKGTGFFCKIPFLDNKYLYCLITNNHLINENHFEKDCKIFFTIDNNKIKKEIIIGKRRTYTSKKYDTTIIEIFEDKDDIHDFLELDFDINGDNYYNNMYINKSIYILQYPNNEKVSVSYGIIKDIDFFQTFDIRHFCITDNGSSGSPIMNLINYKLLGIHKGTDKNYNYNKGTLLIYPVKEFISQIGKKKNFIKGVLDIQLNEINESVMYSKEGIDIYLNNKKINMIKENKECTIEYNFEKNGQPIFEININENVTSMEGFFENCSNIISLDLSNFDSSNINNMSFMFTDCNKLKEIKGINKLNTNKVKDMNCMFQECNELESLDLSNFDTSTVTDMSFMFNQCNKLIEIKGINNFDTNKVTNMGSMFQECNELEYLDLSNFDTSNVIDMSFIFNQCNKLKEIKGITNFNTNKVTNMSSMFQKCNNLKYLDLSNFNTSNVLYMKSMFNKCDSLKKIKGINSFITNKVTDFEAMFQGCEEYEYLDLSNFDTSNATNMSWMFNICYKLKEIKGINNFSTNKVTNMKAMFQGCIKLEFLNLSNFDTSNVTDMSLMFKECNNLKEIKGINNFNLNKVVDKKAMFQNCKELENLNLSHFNK